MQCFGIEIRFVEIVFDRAFTLGSVAVDMGHRAESLGESLGQTGPGGPGWVTPKLPFTWGPGLWVNPKKRSIGRESG